MNLSAVDSIANAVLYEGYILYPYRPSSVKNRQRWTFGGIYPRAYSEAQVGSDAWRVSFECLVLARDTPGGEDTPSVDVRVRFLHLLDRRANDVAGPSWQEAVERETQVPILDVEALTRHPASIEFLFS